jgi:two-component sensor histidine kinase
MNFIKLYLTFFLLNCFAGSGFCQIAAVDSTSILQRRLKYSRPDTSKIEMLLKLGSRYLEGKLHSKSHADSALLLYKQAYGLSKKLKNNLYACQSVSALAAYYIKTGNVTKGRLQFKKVISYYQKIKDKSKEAEALNSLAESLFFIGDVAYKDEYNQYVAKAQNLYRQTGNKLMLSYLRCWKIRDLYHDEKYSEAEKEALLMRAEHIKMKETGASYFWVLNMLVNITTMRGDLYLQLVYELETLEAMQKHPEYATVSALESCYFQLSTIYYGLRNYEKCIYYVSKQLPLTRQLNGSYTYGLRYWVYSLIEQKQPKEALKVLQKISTEYPSLDTEHQVTLYELFGDVYLALKKYPLAEKALLKSVQLYEISDPAHTSYDSFSAAYFPLADYYLFTRNFAKARPILAQLKKTIHKLPPSYQSSFAFAESRVDSAQGNYLSALRKYQQFKHTNDSLMKADRVAKLNQLEISYGTRQKTSQINLLNAENKTHISEVKRATMERNITITGIILLAVILALMIYSFKVKVRVNRLLSIQKGQIESRNHSLTQLVEEKEALIHEKEGLLLDKDMLLKEVHHRVKNNLQIVMSLLSTQLVYLENKEAVNAIEESQQRVQSIALIHQKLYRESTGSSIDLHSYLHDLVDDLDNSFNAIQRGIRFVLKVDEIHLDVDQAVPIGLILNEAITNAIKYAFDSNGGKIYVSIHQLADQLELIVKDNGKGLPADFNLTSSTTLGMEMMRGLGKQLRGMLQISNIDGVTLQLVFPVAKTSSQLVMASANSQ